MAEDLQSPTKEQDQDQAATTPATDNEEAGAYWETQQSKVIPHPLNEIMPEPFCGCWNGEDEIEPGDPDCSCGEEVNIVEWRWVAPKRSPKWVELLQDDKQVVFHPLYSSGTAVVKGNLEIKHNMLYYWEVKMLTQPYGTDIMVGLGTKEQADFHRDFTSFLGGNEDSYGLSYTGAVCQKSQVIDDCPGFCMGTVVGVMVDMFHGTLEFYLNREPQGICFTDLRRHKALYPMMSSTAAQSSLKLVYASSWHNSLLFDAAKVLAASATGAYLLDEMPPGLAQIMENEPWIPLPSAGKVFPDDDGAEKSSRVIRVRIKEGRRW